MTLAVRLTALALGLLSVGAAVRAIQTVPQAPLATPLLVDLTRGLLAQQHPDGSFDPYPADVELPEVLRTVPHALGTAALARAWRLGVGTQLPELAGRLHAALDVLIDRQQPGGFFGRSPPGRPDTDRWPSVESTAAGTLALSLAARPSDAGGLTGSLLALERTVSVGLRDGWTRGLVAMTLDAAAARGANSLVGRDPRGGLELGEPDLLPDARDEPVAEAITRRILGAPGPYADQVTDAVRAVVPVYEGERSNLQSWWMQAWLVARSPGGGQERWFRPLKAALEAALLAPPKGQIAESWYADSVTEGAAGILALAEGLDPLGPGPFPGLAAVRAALEAE